jgi:4-amino-4-deoxy-L-arabinose transferase-like glycosyltransferase
LAFRYIPAVMRRYRYILLVLLGAAVVFLIGLHATPLIDRDEPRYAQASKQMLESGNWIVPYYLDDERLKKPIFIYWCQALSMRVLGPSTLAARLPSVIAFLIAMLLLAWAFTREVGLKRTAWTLFILSTCVLSLWAAKTTLTDAVLLVWITIAQLCLYQMWRGRTTNGLMVVLGIAIGLATLTKGPVVLMFMGMTVVALGALRLTIRQRIASVEVPVEPAPDAPSKEEARQARRSSGERFPMAATIAIRLAIVVGCALVVLLPWATALERWQSGTLWRMFHDEVVVRGKSAQEGHSGPPGYYLVTVFLAWFPWALMLPATAVYAWKRRREPHVRFALAAIIGPWLFLEIYKTKLMHYLLPAYPFLSLLTAEMLLAAARRHIPDLSSWFYLTTNKVMAVLLIMLGVGALVMPPIFFGAESGMFYVAGVLLVIAYALTGLGAAREFLALRPARGALVLGLGTWLICAVSWGLYFPNASYLNISRNVADSLRASGASGEIRMVGYKEGSLAFYQGGTIREQSDESFLTTTPRSNWPAWLVVTKTFWDAQSIDVKDRWDLISEHRGFNIAEGEPYYVMVMRKR